MPGLVNTISVKNQRPRSTQPGHPSVGRRSKYQQKLGSKQAHQASRDALAHVRGLAVSAGVWLRTS